MITNQLSEIKDFLNEKAAKYNHPDFIETDPVQIPHLFSDKNDIEIAAFFASTIAWGQRITIIKNMQKLIALMDHSPYEFIVDSSEKELERLNYFKHRTFNGEDCKFFARSLQNIYKNYGGLGELFQNLYAKEKSIFNTLINFREVFFEIQHPDRTEKHISNVTKGASAKRLNIFIQAIKVVILNFIKVN